ncbi:MAG: adenosine deaminase [Lachnospira sp.]|nr:adenosine deaminase [Lachnospira sp.]
MVDLHLHLDGSLRPSTILELAKEQGIVFPENVKFAVSDNCDSLVEYLKCFDWPLLVLQKEYAIERVVYELVEDLECAGVDYAEIRFAPQLSTKEGLTQTEVIEAAIRGLNRALSIFKGIDAKLILCCMRGDDNEEANIETVELAKRFLGKGVVAIDLAGAESLFSTDKFDAVFAKAKLHGIPFTIHAGEAAGPESIKKAIEFGATRIGHGIRAIESKEVIRILKEKNITLEVCVSSNVQTKACKSLKEHPIRALFDEGVKVTYNTDNMTVSNTTLLKERNILKTEFGFNENELSLMEKYSYDARF